MLGVSFYPMFAGKLLDCGGSRASHLGWDTLARFWLHHWRLAGKTCISVKLNAERI